MFRNPPEQSSRSNMFVNPGDGAGSSYVDAERLKEASVPVETLVGAANGAVTGAIVSSVVSGAVTAAKTDPAVLRESSLVRTAMKNIFQAHLGGVIAGIALFSGFGALVRYSRASKHNEWANRHFELMEGKVRSSQTDRIEQERNTPPSQQR